MLKNEHSFIYHKLNNFYVCFIECIVTWFPFFPSSLTLGGEFYNKKKDNYNSDDVVWHI